MFAYYKSNDTQYCLDIPTCSIQATYTNHGTVS